MVVDAVVVDDVIHKVEVMFSVGNAVLGVLDYISHDRRRVVVVDAHLSNVLNISATR